MTLFPSAGRAGTFLLPVVLLAALPLAACKTTPVNETEYNDPRYSGPAKGGMFGDGGLTFGGTKKGPDEAAAGGTGIGVNAFLWRAALDTLSFMPLASADPFGGVIITDWYQPPESSGERFKATAYIMSRQLRADAVRISVFRQQLATNGQWVDAPVTASTTGELENKVLARARELRASSARS